MKPIKTPEEKNKQAMLITQSRGQLEASVLKMESHLDREEFEDYCDAMAICTTFMTKVISRIKHTILSDPPVNVGANNTGAEITNFEEDDLPF